MAGALQAVLDVAAGRGNNPDGPGGVLIVVGVILVVVALAGTGVWLAQRRGRGRAETQEREPHERGRVGRL